MLPKEAILISVFSALQPQVLMFACEYSVFRYLKGYFQFSMSVLVRLREQNYHIGFRKRLRFVCMSPHLSIQVFRHNV